ncbi:MAG: hypothetical protein RLY71_594 [Pseudomonadota bacterium]|jgi:hypothetical protein
MKVGLLTVHGMGDTSRGYENDLLKALRKNLRSDEFQCYPVYYQDLLQKNEEAVWRKVEKLVHYDDLRKFILFGFADAAGLENRKEVMGSVYELAQRLIVDQMLQAREDLGPDAPLVLVAQSLGCQVISSYLWDAALAVRAKSGASGAFYPEAGVFRQGSVDARGWSLEHLQYLAGSKLMALHTTGCNIPIFVAAHQKMNIQPIEAPNDQFRWLNYYDPDDVLGWPLQPLGNGYEKLVQDRRINSGSGVLGFIMKSWNPMSHTAYWTDGDVVGSVAEDITRLSLP